MKNPFYTILTPILAVGVTLLGFFLLQPAEPTALYWINMMWLIALEVLFFVWLRWGRLSSRFDEEQTVPFRLFLGVMTLYYIIACIVWMIFFFICGTKVGLTLRIYLFGILALTVLWVVLSSIMGRHDAAYNSQQTALENNTYTQRDFVAELKEQAAEHQTAETKRAWATLIRDAESVPPAQFAAKVDSLRARAQKLL